MTPEELMKPRYKVIAGYPNSPYEMGLLITTDEWLWVNSNLRLADKDVDKYPHLFKKLEWWEERSVEDMPEYVKKDNSQVYKVKEWDDSSVVWVFVNTKIHTGFIKECTETVIYPHYFPATKEEYEQFIVSKQSLHVKQ